LVACYWDYRLMLHALIFIEDFNIKNWVDPIFSFFLFNIVASLESLICKEKK
ncbi:hypothetical protein ACJX0J_024018, partial [Zea mays]